MQKIILLPFVSLLFIPLLNAQKVVPLKPHIYTITISGDSVNTRSSGYLASVSDTSIFISPSAVYFTGYQSNNVKSTRIDYNNLNQVQLRRTGSTGRGILKGSVGGFLFGALLSSLTYTRPKDDVERFAYALFGVNRTTITIAGGLSGALAGTL
jgi:hypothetical protein